MNIFSEGNDLQEASKEDGANPDHGEPFVRVLAASSFTMKKNDHQWNSVDFTLLVRPPANRLPASITPPALGEQTSPDTPRFSVVVIGTCAHGERVEYFANRDYTCSGGGESGDVEVWTAINDQALAPTRFSAFVLLVPGNIICASDTNNLSDYYVRPNAGATLYNQVRILRAPSVYTSMTIGDRRQTKFRIGALVANLAPDKRVTAVISSDGWESVSIVPLRYQSRHCVAYDGVAESPNQNQVEYWECAVSFLAFINHDVQCDSQIDTTASSGLGVSCPEQQQQQQRHEGYCDVPMAGTDSSIGTAGGEAMATLMNLSGQDNTPTDTAVLQLEFALRYEVADEEFWDNNYGANHCIRLPITM